MNNKDKKKYCCPSCNFNTNNINHYERHKLTRKHTQPDYKTNKYTNYAQQLRCTKCSKQYCSRSGLWKHSNICEYENNNSIETSKIDNVVIGLLNKEQYINSVIGPLIQEKINSYMPESIDKYVKEIVDNYIKEYINDYASKYIKEPIHKEKPLTQIITQLEKHKKKDQSITKKFDITTFLNEECKNAINMSDFIRSIDVSLDDLSFVKSNGLIKSLSSILVAHLSETDIHIRPIHCTDRKRNIMYVKENNKWQKDDGQLILRKSFLHLANKEYSSIKKWMDVNPQWELNARLQDIHSKMLINILHDIQNDIRGQQQVIKDISHIIYLDKVPNLLHSSSTTTPSAAIVAVLSPILSPAAVAAAATMASNTST
jgi:hypothetical protein